MEIKKKVFLMSRGLQCIGRSFKTYIHSKNHKPYFQVRRVAKTKNGPVCTFKSYNII